MVCPKCRSEVPPDAPKCPGCQLVTPRGREIEAAEKKKKAKQKKTIASFRTTGTGSRPAPAFNLKTLNWKDPRSWQSLAAAIPRWAIYAVLAVLFLGGGYWGYGYIYAPPPKEKAQATIAAINQTKIRPSKIEGATLDKALKEALAKSK